MLVNFIFRRWISYYEYTGVVAVAQTLDSVETVEAVFGLLRNNEEKQREHLKDKKDKVDLKEVGYLTVHIHADLDWLLKNVEKAKSNVGSKLKH